MEGVAIIQGTDFVYANKSMVDMLGVGGPDRVHPKIGVNTNSIEKNSARSRVRLKLYSISIFLKFKVKVRRDPLIQESRYI